MSQPTSQSGRVLILLAGFFGWLLAGVQLGVSSLVMRPAVQDLLQTDDDAILGPWFGWLTSVFLLGGAAGGYLFGALGDRIGRKKAMAMSIATYSVFAGASSLVTSAEQLLLMRFLIGLGVGGMWPNGIALVSEAWPGMSRPMVAGVIGTAANVGIMLISIVTWFIDVNHDSWRWVMQLTALPIFRAVFVWVFVPESVRWLAAVAQPASSEQPTQSPLVEVFQPPILATTLLGIVLGTIPLFGGWGSANWANAWASAVGDKPVETKSADDSTNESTDNPTQPESKPGQDNTPEQADPMVESAKQESESEEAQQIDASLKARALLARSGPGSLASLLGGAVATWLGRRRFSRGHALYRSSHGANCE